MRWQGRRESAQVEDRRGRRVGGRGLRVGGLGGGAILLVLAVSLLTGQNPLELLGSLEGPVPVERTEVGTPGAPAADDEGSRFVRVVLADTEDTWTRLFADRGARYELPRLVLFSDAVESACGFNSAAVGPFYCPPDRQVYLDLAFFSELHRRFGAPGDFAQAYVIAHEVGHHVQNLLGVSGEVHRLQARADREEANALSVRLELQADCLAGVWGHYANRERDFLEPGDVEEGLRAAAAIGDDALQRQAGRTVQPESWTHGSAEQRVSWLRRGLAGGRVEQCDTFSDERL
jgi:hypothetical protein